MAGIFRLIVKPFSFLVTLYYPEAFVFAVLTNKPWSEFTAARWATGCFWHSKSHQ